MRALFVLALIVSVLSFSLAGPVAFDHGSLQDLATGVIPPPPEFTSFFHGPFPTVTSASGTLVSQITSTSTLSNSDLPSATAASYSSSFSLVTSSATAVASSVVDATTVSVSSDSTTTSQSIAETSTLSSATTTATATASTSATATADFLRGVNIGNWLVLEKWMDTTGLFSGAFANAVDEYTFDQISGAAEVLETHWSTWFNESDMAYLSSTGINAVRIPIGYWAYNNTGTPYIQGADAYLEQAVGWARTYGMKVWVDCHGSPGSQNGYDNSGHAGNVEWQAADNLNLSISVLVAMATKYGSSDYSDVVVGLELTNEPISWAPNDFTTTQQFARDAYDAVKAAATNPNFEVIMHDGFMPAAEYWISMPSELGTTTSRLFEIDTHLYQVFDDRYTSMNGPEHIAAACAWSANLSTANAVLPIYAGEWSAAMDICIDTTDNTTTAGITCSTSDCQCTTSADLSDYSAGLIEISGKFVEAQLDTFEQNASGYFLWAYKAPGGWGFQNLIEAGIMPNPVTTRHWPSQCSGSTTASS